MERQDKELFENLVGGGGTSFKISLSKPSFKDQKETDRFWGRNFSFDASVTRTKFKEIHFAQKIKTRSSVTVKNSATGKMNDGELHTIKIKLPSTVVKTANKKEMIESELRILEVNDGLLGVQFGW